MMFRPVALNLIYCFICVSVVGWKEAVLEVGGITTSGLEGLFCRVMRSLINIMVLLSYFNYMQLFICALLSILPENYRIYSISDIFLHILCKLETD